MSTQTKQVSHTSGPWEFKYDADGDHAILGKHGDLSTLVAVTSGDVGVGHEEDAANARLIACAPSLLEALEDVLEVIEYGRTHTAIELRRFLFGRDATFTHASLKTAEAAIRKAKGLGLGSVLAAKERI